VLLAIGLTPVVANVTSAVGVVPGSLAGAYAYRRQLGPLRALVAPLLPALLIVAAGLIAGQPALARAVARRRRHLGRGGPRPVVEGAATLRGGPVVLVLSIAVAVYGGYFGAAVSVMYLALLGALIGGLQASNGVKNVLTALSCGAACVVFVLRADVNWAAAALLAVGSTAGGVVGGRFGQRLPDPVLRLAVVLIALTTAAVQTVRG